MLLSKAALQQACMLLAAGGLGAGTMVTVQRVQHGQRDHRPALTSGAGTGQPVRPARHVLNASRLQSSRATETECVVEGEAAPEVVPADKAVALSRPAAKPIKAMEASDKLPPVVDEA